MKNLLFTTWNGSFRPGIGPFKLLIVTIIVIFFCSISNAIEMKGMSYTAWEPNALFTEDSNTSLANAEQIGCNWIGLCVWWFQDDVNSVLIEPDYSLFSATPESVIHAINKCHELGMKVMLKPMVDCRNEIWRGHINPTQEWFATYQDFINFWADIAQDNNVQLFCVGCEFVNTSGWSSSWRNVIQDIRNHYSGPLTYAANKDNEPDISWWDELDYIGIDAYYPLTDKNDPTLAELETAWSSRADAIEVWRNNNWPDKQIIFTEVGYRSIDGTNQAPAGKPPPPYPIDVQEQADCYNALLNQCKEREWWSGVFWWNWEVDPNAGGPNSPYFTPQNKPAEAVLAHHYVCLRSDLNRDSKVDFEDLRMLAVYWLSYNPSVDISPAPDGDSVINFRDLADFAEEWMTSLYLGGDINGDCKVDFEDLGRLTDRWLWTGLPGSVSEDINRNGHADFVDYAFLAETWMEAPPP